MVAPNLSHVGSVRVVCMLEIVYNYIMLFMCTRICYLDVLQYVIYMYQNMFVDIYLIVGISRSSIQLAWDFTTASKHFLTKRYGRVSQACSTTTMLNTPTSLPMHISEDRLFLLLKRWALVSGVPFMEQLSMITGLLCCSEIDSPMGRSNNVCMHACKSPEYPFHIHAKSVMYVQNRDTRSCVTSTLPILTDMFHIAFARNLYIKEPCWIRLE